MTIKEKQTEIDKYCDTKRRCTHGEKYPCPLYGFNEDCSCGEDEIIERNFKLVSEMPDYVGNKEAVNSVNHPSHYNQGGIECIDAMISAFGNEKVADFCIINAFKYIWRYTHKNGKEDIDKALWYMNKYKELVEGVNE